MAGISTWRTQLRPPGAAGEFVLNQQQIQLAFNQNKCRSGRYQHVADAEEDEELDNLIGHLERKDDAAARMADIKVRSKTPRAEQRLGRCRAPKANVLQSAWLALPGTPSGSFDDVGAAGEGVVFTGFIKLNMVSTFSASTGAAGEGVALCRMWVHCRGGRQGVPRRWPRAGAPDGQQALVAVRRLRPPL